MGGVGAVVYGFMRQAYTAFYAPLGLTPEQVGLTQATIVADAAALLGLLVLLPAVVLACGALGQRTAVVTKPLVAPDRRVLVGVVLVVVLPLAALAGLLRLTAAVPGTRPVLVVALVAVSLSHWWLVAPARDLAPAIVDRRGRLLSWAVVLVAGVLWGALLLGSPGAALGDRVLPLVVGLGAIAAAFVHSGPAGPLLRSGVAIALPFLGLVGLIASADGLVETVATLCAFAYLIGVGLGYQVAWDGVVRVLRRVFPGHSRVRNGVPAALLAAGATGLALWLLIQLLEGADRDARALLEEGSLPGAPVGLVSVLVVPVELVFEPGSPGAERVCDGESAVALLGRADGAIVLLLREEGERARVVTVPSEGVVVVTGREEFGPCPPPG